MKFCPECESMLYYREENNQLNDVCNDCGYSQVCENHVIESSIYNIKKLQNVDTKNYVRYDNSLPRTVHKKCANNDCESRKNNNIQEAVYYPDQHTLKLIYVCTVCNTQWQYS